jgi:hypothetical protein
MDRTEESLKKIKNVHKACLTALQTINQKIDQSFSLSDFSFVQSHKI